MDDSFSDILKYQLKKLFPLISAIFLMLIAYVPIHIPFSKFLRPDVGMICVYFWALYRRDLFGPISVAILGIIIDSLGAVPCGVNMFVFIFIYVMSVTYGTFVNTKPFVISWLGFAIISFIAFFVKWLLMSVYYSLFLSVPGIFIGYIATVLLYPLIARLNVFIQNRLISNEEVIYE